MLATRKNPETVLEALDAAATRYAKSGGDLYNIACAAAVSARILRQLDVADGAEKLRDKAISLLTDSTKEGFRHLEHIASDVDLLELNADPRFVRLLSEIGPKELLDHRGLEFAVIDARGEVRNGSTESVLDDSTGALRRPFQIGRVYAVGMYEITEAQYSASGLRQKYTAKPVSVTWHQAARYCNWLSREEGIPEDQWCYRPAEPASERLELKSNWQDLTGYRMPTEEEWEFACRAGTDTEHSFGRDPGLHRDFAWYGFSSDYSEPRQIGLLRANGFGLFDMHGNMWEWCDSMYWRTTAEPPTGKVATEESRWVLRGGDVYWPKNATSSSYRSPQARDQPNDTVGFRVSRTLRLLP